ncbi:MAG: hypothetical protein AVDCRST_MAG50-2155 [uncultured Acidimicrobiales bacterium]|uniref:Uncharacterized protein n=1 Tax=uncultured Acidimicrobiales bacterium TaxID=310071 RepID=A0A6J4I2R4_9ACTN|nr:MAG: hypothetical protein AVDCRST_MAG50-2155 [uncultured Acidimicrobiales bacterium]
MTDLDLKQVLAEIEAEVRLRRASGQFTLAMERELDDTFEALTPTARRAQDFQSALEEVEEAAFIDVDLPVASNAPGGTQAKLALGRLMTWALRHVAQQTTTFAGTTARALRVLSSRIDALDDEVRRVEALLSDRSEEADAERQLHIAELEIGAWHDRLALAFAGSTGRVLHADCGSGGLVALLESSGIDAYGVEPLPRLADVAVANRIEVRLDSVAAHLARVPDEALAGIVLSGCVDRLVPPDLIRLANAVTRVLQPGGRLAIVSSTPAGWMATTTPVIADLSGGRPVHPETWLTLLAQRGFVDPVHEPGRARSPLEPLPSSVVGADELEPRLAALFAAAFPPTDYLVLADRGS